MNVRIKIAKSYCPTIRLRSSSEICGSTYNSLSCSDVNCGSTELGGLFSRIGEVAPGTKHQGVLAEGGRHAAEPSECGTLCRGRLAPSSRDVKYEQLIWSLDELEERAGRSRVKTSQLA